MTADVVLRASSADRHCAIAQITPNSSAVTPRHTATRVTETPPSAMHHQMSGSDTTRKTSDTAQAATSFPTAISAGVSNVVCRMASTPRSRSPLTDCAVSAGTTNSASPVEELQEVDEREQLAGPLSSARGGNAVGRGRELQCLAGSERVVRAEGVARTRSSLVLPAPLGPTSAVTWPGGTSRSTSATATTSPKVRRTPPASTPAGGSVMGVAAQ